MRRGFTAPILLLLVGLFLVFSTLFWIVSNNVSVTETDPSVKGTSTKSETYSKPGLSVFVTSSGGTWELVELLCKDYDSCVSSLDYGKRFGTSGGGTATSQEVFIQYDPQWADYQYLKLYVRPSFGSKSIYYKPQSLGDVPETKIVALKAMAQEVQAVLVPLSGVKDKYLRSASFTD